jgi:ACS family hexuronate transporter-like MFS transporter
MSFLTKLSDSFPSGKLATVVGLSGASGGIGGMVSSLVVGTVVDRFSFTPVFAASGVVYPLALAVLLARPRALLSRMFHDVSGSAD